MATPASTEARELELVGKVELRIALAKDDKLESILKTYLPPLLLKLASDHVSVRNKVISICQHIKIRLGGNQSVVLPVAALLKQYKEYPESSMIRHFDLLFIQQSIGKLSPSEQLDLLPILIHGLSKDAGKPTCPTVFNLFLRLLPRVRLPPRGSKEDAALRDELGLNDNSDDARFVATWLGKLILLSIVRSKPADPNTRISSPGLTPDEYDFLTVHGKSEAWDPNSPEGLNLTETKILALNLLASGAFIDAERFIPALFGGADSNSRISSIAEDLLKRTSVSFEDEDLIKKLYDIYGTAKPPLKIRILSIFSKSVLATTFITKIVGIIQDGMQSNDETSKIQGLEASRLRNAMFNFMNWVSRTSPQKDVQEIAPPLMRSLRGYIQDQGWPVPTNRSSDEASLRALAYETLGSLAKTVPSMVVEPDLDLVKWLFQSLTEDSSSDIISISIEGALASLLNSFVLPLEPAVKRELQLLLLKYMEQEEGENIIRSARFVSVRWANRCLEYNDIVGRWIDILALSGRSGERSDVVEEGGKGLDPYWYRLLNPSEVGGQAVLPDLDALIKVFFTGHSLLENSHIANSMRGGMEVDGVSVFGNFSESKINAFPDAVHYCREVLLLHALEQSNPNLTQEADWERQLDVLLRTDTISRRQIRDYIKTVDKNTLSIFLSASFEGMLRNDGNGLRDCGQTFDEISCLVPENFLDEIAPRASELLPSVKSNNAATRFIAAEAIGILGSHPANDKETFTAFVCTISETVKSWPSAIGSEANVVHGSVVALGYLLSRAVFYGRIRDLKEELVDGIVTQVLDIVLHAKDSTNKEAAFTAIGLLSVSGVLTVENVQRSTYKIDDIITSLSEDSKKGVEKAITALGRLSLVFDDTYEGEEKPFNKILQALYGIHELRHAEVQFTIGEALSCVSARWESESLPLNLHIDPQYHGKGPASDVLISMLEKVLSDSKMTKPSLRKASGIWLFCLIQYCGHLKEIQARLRECQAAFMGLLTTRDDLVQETASRGLSLVYERGDQDLKERLVSDLVASFTGTSAKVNVDADTELFEPGALPTTDGESITSYKDIMSLAAEVGDQSLVYKFMSLASNAATWSTRAAFGRFGLSNILSSSKIDPKLYPKLYRYRFDPNPNVQRSMNDIWNALVKSPNAVIDEYFDAIMTDLLKSVLGREWRTRQASCAAIADLVQGRQFEKYEKYLSQIWEVALKVLDDIKGSVRKAAESLCQVLTGILVRQLEQGTSSKNAQVMLKEVMPFLFSTRGLESPAKDVQKFAYDTVLELVKKGGKTLLPFVPSLIEQILGLLSTLEPDFINYIYLNAEKYDTTEEKIDQARTTMISHSPMMESIERCLDLLDEPSMAKLVPCLENVIKTAVGMPSKVGCSGVLVSLATRHSLLFRPHADIFLKDMEKAVLDRNSTVSAAYSRATGYLARLASDQQVLKLATYSKNLYFSAEDENRRQVSADIVYSVSRYATDRFNSLASDFLPFVFLAKHDSDEHVKEHFEKTWSENVGGSRAVLLYLKEIISLSEEHLASAKWTVKHTAALTIADVVTSAGTDVGIANAKVIWPVLEKALAMKTFDGKKKVLESFIKFTKSAKPFWEADATISAQMKKIAIREANRNNETYRPHAFLALGEYAHLRTDIDIFNDVYNIILPKIEDLLDENSMDTSTDHDNDAKTASSLHSRTLTAGVTALFNAINTSLPPPPPPTTHIPQLLELLKRLLPSPKSTLPTLIAFYTQTKLLFTALSKQTHPQEENNYALAIGFFELLDLPSGAGSESVRTTKAEAAEGIVLALKVGAFGMWWEGREEVKERLGELVRRAGENERSGTVLGVLEKVGRGLEEE